ncbi:hypothetical protein PISMIDRAFT_209133 [Pisolithus microcarpus 441]|uniref:Unplaced genomic scaffold scaffold_132, whole genome shotgun sequence n=1 Tax=Pisolithus microcarpus 441 TaxID=765257 RepID=A0A0C9Z655_9AGAM|nr:hypothetical protein BKA83DRAFT_209133 [Pisolithus microcarpus]KIK17907.1 hypothetical protein PISMIDRAFT_209133 [Pisolithus microcarpus 441]
MHHTQINPVASLAVVSCVLFIYDYTLTFAKEIDLFWLQPRQTWAFAFFIANRYIGLFGRIPVFLVFLSPNSGGPDSPVCLGLGRVNRIISMVLQLIGAIIMIVRVYAFYNKDRRILSLLVAVGMIGLGLFCWAFSFRPPEPTVIAQDTYAGCSQLTSVEASCRCKFVHVLMRMYLTHTFCLDWAATWGGQLLLDTVVFTLTLKKLISARSLGKWSFMALSLRDDVFYASKSEMQRNSVSPTGAIYFAVMTAVNVANIATYLVLADPYRAILSCPTNMLCATMISRLMLNLRDLEHELMV